MTWERRLRDLLLAGGAIAALGCSTNDDSTGGVPCGNANPDPCICGRPDASAAAATSCDLEKACQANGGEFQLAVEQSDGAELVDDCLFPDAGVDGD